MTSQSTGCALLMPAEMTVVDRDAIASGLPEHTLIEAAGRAVATEICRRYARRPALILCGPGNNGADGYVTARHLDAWGWKVTVASVGPSPAGEVQKAARTCKARVLCATPETVTGHGLIVDAMFGTGLGRPIEGRPAEVVRAVNASGANVIAIDIPSGVDGASGKLLGTAIQAQLTATFVRAKPGHLLLPGRGCTGELAVLDIGISEKSVNAANPSTFWNKPPLWEHLLPKPVGATHKYRRGHALAISGPVWGTGAIRLAAMAALRAGAGLATIASGLDALPVHAGHATAIMLREAGSPARLERMLEDRRMTAVLIGPGRGVGGETRAMTRVCLASGAGVVIDADALTSFASSVDELRVAISERPERPVIVTPHEGEFARLMDLKGSKLDRCRTMAEVLGCVVILKGADTVVAASDGRASIGSNAPAYLATAGTGDVLAGIALGLLAQGMPAFETASAAVWVHGEAAAGIGPGLIAEDLPQALPAVLRELLG